MTYQQAESRHKELCELEMHRNLTREEWALMRDCEQVMQYEDYCELGI
ncbi:hypothetical protein UFOVP635_4 [uncultured Caudovirales phage]|uniref:Uncharacterized protein n=1 Tax=uncultured Caudovirales phage TaxID=2100421 RepID=A0A6J5N8P9_9CAUD|nr:hypothetical protein UFOVP635_4 [uncultured Caudovirales phage]